MPIWWHQLIQGPCYLINLRVSQKQNENLMIPLSLILPSKLLPIIWFALFHSYDPQKLQLHLQRQKPDIKTHPLPTSTAASPCYFHSKYTEFIIHNLDRYTYEHSVAYQCWSSQIIMHIIYWRFHPHIVSQREITLPVYDYWSW